MPTRCRPTAGGRDRVRDHPRIALRNFAAHPSYHLGTPVDAADNIADQAQIINGLWGVSSSATITRAIMAVGWDDRTVTRSRAEVFSPERLSEDAAFVLHQADPTDRLDSYD